MRVTEGTATLSAPYTFQDAGTLALCGLQLPERYALDPHWAERAALLPYATQGLLEWRAEGRQPADLMCSARQGTHAWKSWWTQAMPPSLATPPLSVHEAWLEQDAPSEANNAPTFGFFWNIPYVQHANLTEQLTHGGPNTPNTSRSEDPAYSEAVHLEAVHLEAANSDAADFDAAHPETADFDAADTEAAHPETADPVTALDALNRAYPAFQGAITRTKALLTRGLPIRWLGMFPSRDQLPALRLNLSRQHPSALEALLDEAPSSFRSLYERVHATIDDNTEVAWCWDQSAEGPSRLMAELTPARALVGLNERQTQIARILTRFGEEQPWLEDALALNQQFHSYEWAVPPADDRALPFCVDLLVSPQNERPQLLRYISHLKVELDPTVPAGPFKAKIYGLFSLPGSGLTRPTCGSPEDPRNAPVWPELAHALRDAPWPPSLATLRRCWSSWAQTSDDAILHELRQRAQLHLAETLLRGRG